MTAVRSRPTATRRAPMQSRLCTRLSTDSDLRSLTDMAACGGSHPMDIIASMVSGHYRYRATLLRIPAAMHPTAAVLTKCPPPANGRGRWLLPGKSADVARPMSITVCGSPHHQMPNGIVRLRPTSCQRIMWPRAMPLYPPMFRCTLSPGWQRESHRRRWRPKKRSC